MKGFLAILLMMTGPVESGPVATPQPEASKHAEHKSGWVTGESYPEAAREKGQSGVVRMRFLIDPKGEIIACEITESSGFSELDQGSCNLAQKVFRFSPALDKSGKPVSEYWVAGMRWMDPGAARPNYTLYDLRPEAVPDPFDEDRKNEIQTVATKAVMISGGISDDDYPKPALAADEEGTVVVRYLITKTGSASDCMVTKSSGSAILDYATCVLITERFKFQPAKDSEGNVVEETRTQPIRWQIPETSPDSINAYRATSRADIDKSGKVTDCKVENIGTLPEDLDLCGAIAEIESAPAELMSQFPNGFLMVEVYRQSNAEDFVGEEAPQDGSRVMYHIRRVSEVAPDGTVTNCATTSELGYASFLEDFCAGLKYEPLPQGEKSRTIVLEDRVIMFPRPADEPPK